MHKIDELEAKGCIPLNILRKHSDFAQFGPHDPVTANMEFLLRCRESQ